MSDAVETYAGEFKPWWAGISPTAKSMKVLTGPVDADTMEREAGLDWTVSKQPAFVTGEHAQRIKGWNAVQRDTDGSIFGLVKDTYHLFQNHDGFESMAVLLAEGDLLHASAGSLFGGAFAWALAKVGEFYIHGDGSPYEDYLLGYWGHDGRHGFTLASTDVRVVCANTASAAIGGAKHKVTIRHTPNMTARVEDAHKALDLHAKYIEKLQAVLTDLSRRPMTVDEVLNFTVALLPSNPDVEHAFRTEAERKAIADLFSSDTATFAGLDFTAYRAYQAVTQYADHTKDVRTTKTASGADRLAFSIIDGPADALKATALRLLVKA
jgi:phage/plasmid-like protein (TIGR03299 family)